MPVPPLNEQRRIVDAIEAHFTRLDAVVAALKRSQANLRRYRASVLKAACEGRLVPTEAALAQAEGRAYEPADVLLARILTERRRKWEEAEWAKLVEKAQKKVTQERRQAAGRPAKLSNLTDAEWQAVGAEEYKAYLPKNDKWKAKYQEPEPVDVDGLPRLPEGWVWTNLDSVGVITSGYAFKSTDFTDTGIPVVKIANVGYGEFHEVDQEYLPESFMRTYPQYLVHGGALLLALTRPITNNTLKSCVFPLDAEMALLNQRVAMIEVYHNIVSDYTELIFRSDFIKGQVERGMSETLQPNLSPLRLAQFSVPLPPLVEQHCIITEVERRLSVIDALEATVEANLARAERLRQSILKRAFQGKLVPQDPDDEPASVLLERIA